MTDVNLVHCSYHKCLTVYFSRIMHSVFNRCLPWSGGFRHYNSHLQDFYDGFRSQRVASVNNRCLDLDLLDDFRISRFVRDPRDLVVSGYFYHKRGAEPWVAKRAPTAEDWYFANGRIPAGMKGREVSFAQYLQELPQEEGLLAELEFRANHFQSMARWPSRHPGIVVYRYEDIVGKEDRAFQQIFRHYGLSPVERGLGRLFARRYSIRKKRADPHVRNPAPGQWRKHFTPRVRRAFDAEYAALIQQLGYPRT